MKEFWAKLTKPIMALAPMADVTDSAFRQIICKYGKPDVCFTEFVSTDGLCSVGREKLLLDLQFEESERPIVAQIWGSKPKNFFETAKLLRELTFDGIDINMGCPEKNIQKQGGCAALMKNSDLTKEIILATKEGAGGLPVSVKTRTGYERENVAEWVFHLASCEPAAIIIHGRTKKEMSKVPADWEAIKRAASIVRDTSKNILVIGNGDVKSLSEAYDKAEKYDVAGVMIGRGVFGNPWFFNKKINKADLPIREVLRVMTEHARLFEKLFRGKKNFMLMRKHFGSYVSGFEGAKELRLKLMVAKDANEVSEICKNFGD